MIGVLVLARFRFYAELNDFLAPERRFVPFDLVFEGRQTVKHLIESAGIPHTEVDLILVNGRSVDFGELIADGDLVSVYPVFEGFDIAPVRGCAPTVPPDPVRLDTHLGRLAAWLRMIGFDTLYRNDYDDRELARISAERASILLTRDRGLLMRSAVTHGYSCGKPRRGSNSRRWCAGSTWRIAWIHSRAAWSATSRYGASPKKRSPIGCRP